MKRPVIIASVVILACVAAAIGLFVANSNPAVPQTQALQAELKKAQAEVAQLKSRVEKLQEPPPVAKPVVPAPPPAAPATAPAQAESSERAKVRKQFEAQIDLTSGQLFQKFNLDNKERAQLRQLVSDWDLKHYEACMRQTDPSLTPMQRAAAKREDEATREASDASVRQFLNNEDDYKAYLRWMDTRPEIMQLQLGGNVFGDAGEPLSEDQREQLIDLMAATRNAKPDPTDPRNISASSLTPQNIAALVEQMKTDNQHVVDNAAAFLSPAQIDALKKLQQQTLALNEAGMHMMAGAKK